MFLFSNKLDLNQETRFTIADSDIIARLHLAISFISMLSTMYLFIMSMVFKGD